MATSAQITTLRKMTGVSTAEWSDVDLNALIDSQVNTSVNLAAAQIWRTIAASSAALVDVEESGSKRSMSQTYKNALAMAAEFEKLAVAEGASDPDGITTTATRVRRITRT